MNDRSPRRSTRLFRSRQFLLFLATGGVSAVVNFGARIVLNRWMSFSTAVVLAYVVGMITAFLLARVFVFRDSRQAMHRSIGFFVLVNVFSVLQTWAISVALAYWLLPALGVTRFVREIAHVVGLVVPAFTSYVGHKRWTFRA